jgi:HAD superfamily hydrolase (TIGR01509 family)
MTVRESSLRRSVSCAHRQLDAVIFDVDGVLLDSIPVHVRSFDRLFARRGFRLADLVDDHRASSVEHILVCAERELGIRIPADPFNEELAACILTELAGTAVDPQLVRLLEDLRRHGVECAVGSSSNKRVLQGKLELLGIGSFFSILVTAEDVARHKPFPDVYVRAVDLLGAEAARCAVVEDAAAGVAAAHAAGVPVIGFGGFNEDPAAPHGCDLHITRWSELGHDRVSDFVNGPHGNDQNSDG